MAAQTTEFPFQVPATATDVCEVALGMAGRMYGGMNASREVLANRPWKERNEDLRKIAQEVNAEALPDDEEAGPQQTVYRRTKDGELAISAGQIRTFLQEVAADALAGRPNYFVLRRALRRQLFIEPTLIILERGGKAVQEPDGIDYIPRPIRRPPFERSVVHEPEYVDKATVRFNMYIGRFGSGMSITDEVLAFLFAHGGQYVGLGAHRGLTDHEAGEFAVLGWEWRHLQDFQVPAIPSSGVTRSQRKAQGEQADSEKPVERGAG